MPRLVFSALAIVVFCVIALAQPAGTASPQASVSRLTDAELRDLVGVMYEEQQRLTKRVAALEGEVKALRKRLDEAEAELSQLRTTADSSKPNTQGDEVKADPASDTKKPTAPTQSGSADAPAVVSFKQIEITGERWQGKVVRVENVEIGDLSNLWANWVPGVTVSSNGLVSVVNTKAQQQWTGFYAVDGEGNRFHQCVALKESFVDRLLNLDRAKRFRLTGTVLKADRSNMYLLIVTQIDEYAPLPEKK